MSFPSQFHSHFSHIYTPHPQLLPHCSPHKNKYQCPQNPPFSPILQHPSFAPFLQNLHLYFHFLWCFFFHIFFRFHFHLSHLKANTQFAPQSQITQIHQFCPRIPKKVPSKWFGFGPPLQQSSKMHFLVKEKTTKDSSHKIGLLPMSLFLYSLLFRWTYSIAMNPESWISAQVLWILFFICPCHRTRPSSKAQDKAWCLGFGLGVDIAWNMGVGHTFVIINNSFFFQENSTFGKKIMKTWWYEYGLKSISDLHFHYRTFRTNKHLFIFLMAKEFYKNIFYDFSSWKLKRFLINSIFIPEKMIEFTIKHLENISFYFMLKGILLKFQFKIT